MKKTAVICCLLATAATLQYCASSRKVQKETPKVTYLANVRPLIEANCSPCHIPPKGNKEALHTYETAKNNIDESIRRIQLNPGERGFMPFKHPKLPDSTIQVFVQWKNDGLLEK